jgi:hypothetical protein
MDTYKHDQKQYMERMNQTALSKFDLLKPYLNPTIKVLDFGSGYSPDFIEAVVQTGASYTAYDKSLTIQEKLRTLGITFLSEEELLSSKEHFDIVFLSSVFHELVSYLSPDEYKQTLDTLHGILKSGGLLIVRDWANPNDDSISTIPLKAKTKQEVFTWIDALEQNHIFKQVVTKSDTLYASQRDMYQIVFHTVWGLGSLERESKETYDVTDAIGSLSLAYGLTLVSYHAEYDESYLEHLKKYFSIRTLPFATKGIWVFQK